MSANRIPHDFTNCKFGNWTVLGKAKRGWLCKCKCGTIKAQVGSILHSGRTKGCQVCRRKPHRKSREYAVWNAMKARCYNPNVRGFHNHGGRGIVMCDSWRDSFDAFYDDMGPRPSPRHSIDRINNDGNYEPSNCRWATAKEQGRNLRRNHLLTLGGITRCIMEWSEITGIKHYTIWQRIAVLGWSTEEALNIPTGFGKRWAKRTN
jgi:hypothetical protein